MKAIMMTSKGLKISDIPQPIPLANELLIKIQWAGICGSDYPVLNGMKDKSHLIGSVIGHEGSGRVVQLGGNVKGFSIGDTVGIESHRARPSWLKAGKDPYKDPLCAIIGYRGFPNGRMCQGTWAEYIAVPDIYAHKIPHTLYDCYPGSLWEPLGNSIRLASFVQSLKPQPKQVVVSGCGPQGLLVMMILKHWLGFNKMVATDVVKERLALVNRFKLAKPCTPDQLPKVSPDLWLEMSGAIPAFRQALDAVPKGGKLLLFGIPGETDIKLDGIGYKEFVLQGKNTKLKGKELIGITGRFREDWELAPKIIGALCNYIELGELYSYFGPLENIPHLVEAKAVPPKDGNFLKAVFSSFLL